MFYLRGQVETISNKAYTESTKQIHQLVKNADNLTASLKVCYLVGLALTEVVLDAFFTSI